MEGKEGPPESQAALRCVCVGKMHSTCPVLGEILRNVHTGSSTPDLLNGRQGVLASSLRKHAEQCVFSAPILNSRSRGSAQPYMMKTIMALKGSVLLMMNIQYVLS